MSAPAETVSLQKMASVLRIAVPEEGVVRYIPPPPVLVCAVPLRRLP